MEEVLEFWFSELAAKDWFRKDRDLDHKIKTRFLDTFTKATRGELFEWRKSMQGRLAEIIILDQFSRNIFRNDARAFEFDCLALALSQHASVQPESNNLSKAQLGFLYMPHMHSESPLIHTHAVKLFSQPGLEQTLQFELKHKEIIDRFGRYPHRNKILGRESTEEEKEFLKEEGSGF